MILTGKKIIQEYKKGLIQIEPFIDEQIQSVSYKIRLDKRLNTYTEKMLDSAQVNQTKEIEIPESGLILQPGEIYIGRSIETIWTKKYCMILKGRSTTGRLGLFVTICSDLIETDRPCNIELILIVTKKLKIYPEMIIGQVTFWEIKN